MKPPYRPGKVRTAGKKNRVHLAKSVPLSESQMEHIRTKKITRIRSQKEGRGGKRAHWNIDYEEGRVYNMRSMPHRESETLSEKGVRRISKHAR